MIMKILIWDIFLQIVSMYMHAYVIMSVNSSMHHPMDPRIRLKNSQKKQFQQTQQLNQQQKESNNQSNSQIQDIQGLLDIQGIQYIQDNEHINKQDEDKHAVDITYHSITPIQIEQVQLQIRQKQFLQKQEQSESRRDMLVNQRKSEANENEDFIGKVKRKRRTKAEMQAARLLQTRKQPTSKRRSKLKSANQPQSDSQSSFQKLLNYRDKKSIIQLKKLVKQSKKQSTYEQPLLNSSFTISKNSKNILVPVPIRQQFANKQIQVLDEQEYNIFKCIPYANARNITQNCNQSRRYIQEQSKKQLRKEIFQEKQSKLTLRDRTVLESIFVVVKNESSKTTDIRMGQICKICKQIIKPGSSDQEYQQKEIKNSKIKTKRNCYNLNSNKFRAILSPKDHGKVIRKIDKQDDQDDELEEGIFPNP